MNLDYIPSTKEFVLTEMDPEQKAHLRTLPWTRHSNRMDACLPAALALGNDFPGEITATERADIMGRELMRSLAEPTLPPDSEMNPNLLPFQPKGVRHLLRKCHALLADQPGLGKTVMSLEALRIASAHENGPVAALCVVPNTMKYVWAEACHVWAPEFTPIVLQGTTAKRTKLVRAVKGWMHGTRARYLLIVNWESLRILSGQHRYGSCAPSPDGPLNEIPWFAVIADEAHRAKDPHAQQTRALWRVSKDAPYCWALTGTPMLNTPSDLWGVGRFYSPGEYGKSFYKWRERYVRMEETPYAIVDKGLLKRNRAEFHRWFDARCLRRLKADVLDLPELTVQTVPLDMPPKQAQAYRHMQKEMIARIEDKTLVVTNPLSLLARLTQMASALPVVDDQMEVAALRAPSNKVAALKEIVSDHPGQVVVFAMSRKLIELAAHELKAVPHIQITGTVSPQQRASDIALFQAGKRRIAFCTLQAGAEGIDLYAADLVVFLQQAWTPALNDQAIARCHRHGQRNPVTVLNLVSRETVDEDIRKALTEKGHMSEEVLRDQLRRQFAIPQAAPALAV